MDVPKIDKINVFGLAPSLDRMRSVNKIKPLYRGATFWYYFRVWIPYIFPSVALTFLILSLTVYSSVEGNLVLGALLSLIMGIAVVSSYIMIIPWRKHPSSLIVYKALTSISFAINVILEAISTNHDSCRMFAVMTHITVVAGECWLTCIAVDLVYSLTNPFISYKVNLKKYQTIVCSFTAFLAFVFYFDTNCQGSFDQGICWVRVDSTNSPCLWGYFLFWIVCMYAYQCYAAVFAYFRLRKGLPVTFEARKKCAQETFICLMVYALYMLFLVFLFSIIATDPAPKKGSSMAKFSMFFLFMVSAKGSIDGVVWFMLHDFERNENKISNTQDYASLQQTEKDEENETDDNENQEHHHHAIQEVGDEIKKTLTKTITELADLAITDIDETDLSPQVNAALRQQVVQYVTMGVCDSIRKIHKKNPNEEIKNIMDSVFKRGDIAILPNMQVLEFLLDDEYNFKAFSPSIFREIRLREGISDEEYLNILSQPAKERLSEGASGAFMFFCGGSQYIVKTIRDREARVLHKSLTAYNMHLEKYRSSLLCKFLGSYSLQMYSQTFYFVVMLNCFDPSAYINERFDIKGSWVGRSAEPPRSSKKTVCRHCNNYFIPAKKEQCSAVVGPHEANVVLKDNDLRTKISLSKADRSELLRVLMADSDFLGEMGVLDYSLLIGVKKWRFEVAITEDIINYKSNQNAGTRHHQDSRIPFKAQTVTGPALYHLGIVDFLQNWTVQKQIERYFKIYVLRKDPDGLSVMAPLEYKKRFQAKMTQLFDLESSESVEAKSSKPKLDSVVTVYNPIVAKEDSNTKDEEELNLLL